ncbi:MAG: esterase-like activity of phytase family protein [Brevirhabdus sp.]
MRQSLAIALIWLAGAGWAGDLATHLSSFTWRSELDRFGGFSALVLSDDGKRFTVLSDRGRIGTGTIERKNEQITSVDLTRFERLRDTEGAPISKGISDSEGLAIRSDGRIYVSFEGYHRVWTYARVGGKAAWLPRHPEFKRLHRNASLEALAMDARGRIYTIPESPRGESFPVFRYARGKWDTPFTIPARDGFEVTGADIGPDGRFYLLERSFSLLTGFGSRLRRFDLSETGLTNEITLMQSGPFEHDNLEGLSVWRAADGLRATMVSDDNFRALQRTELVEYALPD